MRTEEATIKIVSKLDRLYGSLINQQKVKAIIEEVLYDYDITPKETAIATLDNMNDMILLYLATRKTEGLADSTIKGYGRTLNRLSIYMRKNVEDITTMDLRMYLAAYGKTGVKNSTLATTTDYLKGFFGWLAEDEYISKNPMKKIKTPKTPKKTREPLTKEEYEILKSGAKTMREKALLSFFYSTGCRLQEVVNMRKQNIDWQNLTAKVIEGKGGKDRIVYINANCKVHLKKYLLSRLDDNESLFVIEKSPFTGLGNRGMQRAIDKIQEQSGLHRTISPHILRHTAATHWLSSGMDITVVQEILGHEELSTTQIYAQLSNVEVQHQYRKFS